MKKVISFVLVLALVLGSFSMAFAAEGTTLSDIDDSANKEAIQVVNDLGIVTGYTDGTYKPGQAVNRAEYAAMITRALAIPESALAGYTSTTFKDTTGYGWAVKYLAFCNDKGIMLGDGNGNAMPGRVITVNEAMTMALRAVGYTNNSAVLVGNYPTNYVTLGQSLGMYDSVGNAATVTRENAAQIIYNALTVQLVQVDADGQTTGLKDVDDNAITLLTAGLDCSLVKDVSIDYDDASVISLVDYVGAQANVYKNADGDIVAVEPTSTFLTGSFNSDGKFEVDETVYTLASTVRTTIPAIVNAADVDDVAKDTIQDDTTTTYTLAADVSGKTIKDIYTVATWIVTEAFYAAEDVQEEIADDQTLDGYKFEPDDNDEIDTTKYQVYGVADIEAIAEDDVVYVYTLGNGSKADANIVKIEVGTETVEGTVTKINSDGDEFTIGGKKLAASEKIISAKPKISEEGTATLDYAGDIYEWTITKASSDNYAVITEPYMSAVSGRNATVIVLDKNGNETEYVVDKDIDWDDNATVGSIISFDLDKNGAIDDYVLFTATTTPQALVEDISNVKVSNDYKVIGDYSVAEGAVVFIDNGEDGFEVGTLKDLSTEVTISAIVDVDDRVINAILVDNDNTGSEDSTYGVINSYGTTEYDPEADETYTLADIILEGEVKEGVKTDLDVEPTDYITYSAVLAKITVDEDGVVTAVVDATEDDDVNPVSVSTIAAISGKVITNASNESYRVADDAIIYVWNTDDEVWEVKSVSALKKLDVTLYDTDDDVTNGYEVVMAY